jgi:hypothetical protein
MSGFSEAALQKKLAGRENFCAFLCLPLDILLSYRSVFWIRIPIDPPEICLLDPVVDPYSSCGTGLKFLHKFTYFFPCVFLKIEACTSLLLDQIRRKSVDITKTLLKGSVDPDPHEPALTFWAGF